MLDKMAFFVAVIRHGSISAAARQFNLSVSAGSRWLQELEEHFDVSLCNRNNRQLLPTEAGKKLFEDFSPLVDQAEHLNKSMQGFQRKFRGHLDIACTPVYANHFLLPAIEKFTRSQPEITFNLNITPWALDQASNCDLMISANAYFQGYREKDLHLVKRELMQYPFVLVASPDYIQHAAPLNTPSDLSHHRCLFATTLTGSNDWIFQDQQGTQIVKVPKSIEVNDSDLLLQSAIMGLGLAYLPSFIVEKPLMKGELIQLLAEFDTSIWCLNLYYHSPNSASNISLLFKDFLLQQHL